MVVLGLLWAGAAAGTLAAQTVKRTADLVTCQVLEDIQREELVGTGAPRVRWPREAAASSARVASPLL